MLTEVYKPAIDVHQGGINHQLVCPACKVMSLFVPMNGGTDMALRLTAQNQPSVLGGHRRCSNPTCRAVVYIIREAGKVLFVLPPVLLTFKTEGIPEQVVRAMNETHMCRLNGCMVASAMMLRRTLHLLCDHCGTASGHLRGRIHGLGEKMTVPAALIEVAERLIILDEEAAGIHWERYGTIDHEELDRAIELTTLLIKAMSEYNEVLRRFGAPA